MNRPNGVAVSVLVVQSFILICCVMSLWLFATNFPFPSPLIKPFLAPQQRWPTRQIQQWVRQGDIPKGFFAFFSRDPDRDIPPGMNIVAPADGVVRNIIRKPNRIYVDIALSYWDVHVQRSPVAGVVKAVEDHGDTFMDGEYKNMIFLKDKMAPVQKAIDIDSKQGRIKVRLITSFNARRIRVWIHDGDQLAKGQRIGRILLGSTVILQLPPDTPLAIREGQRVVAGETVISRGEHP